MLITTKKPFEEVKKMLEPYKAVGIVGCADCCATCQTGGSEQIKAMADMLKDKTIVFSLSCEAPCDQRIARRDLRRVEEDVNKSEALLMLTCGIGVQSFGKTLATKPLVPGLNTMFPGSAARIGEFREFCNTCGDCILGVTAGICPVTLCPKGLLNGPCEDMEEGKCHVWNFKRDCIWYDIYGKLKAQNKQDNISQVNASRDWSYKHHPRELVWRR
ncbi:MAG: methylenetetrahydrofolate reductase C-terminal domain-containing protein [Chloroflexi bacterium]|nr:methylenetetrahydrofolate reductase C-terminal domain-containing protein [Chloroflexota bacterium]